MGVRVSVVGPKDLVDIIIEEASNSKDLIMLSYPYKNETETMELINCCINNTDLILFAGPIPYNIARKSVQSDIPMLYVSYSGTALYKALFNYSIIENFKKNKVLRFSIDTIHKNIVEEMLRELDITAYEIYVEEYVNILSSFELEKFHLNHYKEGKTDFILTCLTSTYGALMEMQVPVFRIMPTRISIRETLKMVTLEAQNIILKKAQLCVGIMKIVNFNNHDNYSPSEYQQSRSKLIVNEQYINFCEGIKASMKINGDDEYIFYATRGAIESITNYYQYMPIIQELDMINSIKVCIGLGYGYSANEAEKNSRIALDYAKIYKKNSCYVKMEDGKIRGPLYGGKNIEFYASAKNSNIAMIAERTKLSAMTVNKIFSVLDSYGRNTITATEVAETLNITNRSARRILNSFEQAGVAKIIGDEQPVGKGRPRRIYMINK